jgi:cytochrome c-type biogenesis protein CcmF
MDPKQYFKIYFQAKDNSESFILYPDAFVNYKGNQQLMANPSSKHYIHKDVFTYITSLPNPEKNKDTATFKEHKIKPGDTIFYSRGFMILDGLSRNTGAKEKFVQPGDSVFAAQFTVRALDSSIYQASPVLILRQNTALPIVDTVLSQSLILAFTGAEKDGINVGVKESNAVLEYVTLKAYQFPAINILWLGIIVMTIGFLISAFYKFTSSLRKL